LAWRTGPGRARRWCREFARRWRQAGLSGFEQRSTVTLSGGEKQRLAIADVLAARPGLLVLDEPTANLDPPGMYAVFERLAILARRREHTIVLIEHRLEAALPLADEVLLLDDEGHQLAFAPRGAVGREAVELLERSGAWVPRAWRGAQPAASGAVERRSSERLPAAGRSRPARFCWRPPTFASNTLPTRAGSAWPWMGSRCPCERRASGSRWANGAGKSSLLFAMAGCYGRRTGPCGCARCHGMARRPSPCATLRG